MVDEQQHDLALDGDIAAYNAMKHELEKAHMGKWVVLYQSQLKGAYDSFDAAAQDAIRQFGRGPYLIRQVGERALVLPASAVYSSFRNAG